ncbi:MAG: hypothetical protein U1E91_05490 [Moraxella sp.]
MMDSTNTLAPTAITDDSDAAKRWLHQTQFMLSALPLNCVLPDTGREVAFAGLTNAGKSCINALTQQRQLARSSKTLVLSLILPTHGQFGSAFGGFARVWLCRHAQAMKRMAVRAGKIPNFA